MPPPRRVLDADSIEKLLEKHGVDVDQAYVLEAANEGFEALVELSSCPKLRTLNVNGNRLIDLRQLNGAPHLRELKAGNNRLEDADDIEFCKELETLHLHNNPKLEKAPRSVGRLRHLRTLRLDRCGIVDVGSGLKNCASLRILDLSGNCISGLGSSLASLSGLVELDLSGNELKRIPSGALDGCRASLQELRLADNELGFVQVEPTPLINGVQRKLRRLPAKKQAKAKRTNGPLDGLQRFSNLRSLHLAGNRFSSFVAFPLLSDLAELDVARNRLHDLSGLATKAPSLDVLDASENAIGDLGHLAQALGELSSLAELRLQGNPCVPHVRPKTSRPVSRARPVSRKGPEKPPAWALVCARAAPTLELLDDFHLKNGAPSDAEMRPAKVSRSIEPIGDTDARAVQFRALLGGARATLRDMGRKEVALIAGGCAPPPERPKPTPKDYSGDNALAKRLSGLERALTFGKQQPEDVIKAPLLNTTPVKVVDEAFAINDGDESFLHRKREAWAEEKVEDLHIDSDSSDDEWTGAVVAPSPRRELPPELQTQLDVFLTNTATPAQLQDAAQATAEALKACLQAGQQDSDSDSIDDPEAFAIRTKYEGAKLDYEAAMKSVADEKSGFGDSDADSDTAWPPDASGFCGTDDPLSPSPAKPARRTTPPPVARRSPKKKAAFVVPRRGSKDVVSL